MFLLDLGCQHYLPDIRTDPWSDQIIDIINYIVIPHKVLPLQDLRVLVLQKGIGLDGPVPSLRVWGVNASGCGYPVFLVD